MRPVTFSRVAEVVNDLTNAGRVTREEIAQKLRMSPPRTREVLLEAERLGFIVRDGSSYIPTQRGVEFAIFSGGARWDQIHSLMMDTNPYANLVRLLETSPAPLSPGEILSASGNWPSTLNRATLDVLLDWVERLGSTQRNPFTGRYYRTDGKVNGFESALEKAYEALDTTSVPWLRRKFVEIPRLRELTCEMLRISREAFDSALAGSMQGDPGRIELSGAPFTSRAKRSKKKVKNPPPTIGEGRSSIRLSSQSTLGGLSVGSRDYYYLAMHRREKH